MSHHLYKYRHGIGVALLLAALLNGFLRFDGSWNRFLTMVLVQLWFGQAVYNYARGARGHEQGRRPGVARGLGGLFPVFVWGRVLFEFLTRPGQLQPFYCHGNPL